MTSRRELQLALALTAVGSLLVLWASGRPWADLSGALDPGGTVLHLRGSQVSELPRALSLLALVSVAALIATRSWGRVIVGGVLGLAGLLVVQDAIHTLLTGVLGRVAPDGKVDLCAAGGCFVGGTSSTRVDTAHVWPLATVAGGALLLVAGVLVAVRGRRWAALGSSYEAPGAAVPSAPATDKQVWDALDRGDDPTA